MQVRPRLLVNVAKVVLEAAVLAVAYYFAFLARFEGRVPADSYVTFVGSLPYVVLWKLICLTVFGVPKLTWRYASLYEVRRLLAGLSTASMVLIALRLSHSFAGAVPLGVLFLDCSFSILGSILLRMGVRCITQWSEQQAPISTSRIKVPTLLIGAGSAGAMVAKEIARRPDLGIEPVGFLDDDEKKVGMILHGLRVLGTTACLEAAIRESGATQALIAIGYLSGPDIRRITDLCGGCGIPTKVIPGIREMVDGRVDLCAMRDVAIEDLLHREAVTLDDRAIAEIVGGRTILVSGAGGSIGSQLCRGLCQYAPATLVLVEQAENGLFHLHQQLVRDFPQVRLAPCVADICDRARLAQIFTRWSPEMVFHAAAHKHVPLMEWNPGEAIKNNVMGTRILADLADAFTVDRFVMISTDKAVNPTSIMGVSKRIAEIYVQALSQRSTTQFVTVRFGNVLGSAGSVIPIFKEQISRGGPITITHPEMERYFMTIPEACQLVLQAASMGRGGEIFILDMGEPVKVLDLARDLIRLSGMSLEDIEIHFTGMRPGEKLSEELCRSEEKVEKTHHSKILVGRFCPQGWDKVNRQIDELELMVKGSEVEQIFPKLKEIVPEYDYNGSLPPVEQNSVSSRLASRTKRAHPPAVLPVSG